MQDKYSDLHTVSSENKQAVRESNRNHDQSKKEKETMRKELNETLSKLRELEREHEVKIDLKTADSWDEKYQTF